MTTDPRRRPAAAPPPPAASTPPPAVPDTTTMGLDGTTSPPPPSTSTPHLPVQPSTTKPGHDDSADFTLRFCTVCASNNNRSMEAHLRLTTPTDPASPQPKYPTLSFGTGSLVRLPGPNINSPNVYTFNNTSYASMHAELLAKDERLYRSNGILPILERNKSVKWGPERWQDWAIGVPRTGKRLVPPSASSSSTPNDGTPPAAPAAADTEKAEEAEYRADRGYAGTEAGVVDVVVTCEERCWDAVLDDLLSRGAPLNRPVHVFNVDIKDNHEEALIGGRAILELADALNAAAREARETWAGENGGAVGGVNGFDAGIASARRGFDESVPEILAEWQERWPSLPALWSLAWF